MHVIGNGMLAKAFMAVNVIDNDLVVFCSGVSNSNETSEVQFAREKALLLDTTKTFPIRKIVYFSSCAAGSVESPYYRHKQAMQDLIQAGAQRHLIVRLPQVVGKTKNKTLVNFIAGSVKNLTPITVFADARRNLIDVDDVVRLTLHLAGLDNMAINVTNSSMVAVEEIVRMISDILGMAPIILAGPPDAEAPDYEGGPLKELIGPDDPIYSEGYNQTVLAKYVPLLCE